MTDPVIRKHCDTCEDRTLHARDQCAKADPPRIVTKYVCSECDTVETTTIRFDE